MSMWAYSNSIPTACVGLGALGIDLGLGRVRVKVKVRVRVRIGVRIRVRVRNETLEFGRTLLKTKPNKVKVR